MNNDIQAYRIDFTQCPDIGLRGPDDFECWITTSPEDNTFTRNLSPAVERLNKQHALLSEIHRIASAHHDTPQSALDAICELLAP